jgi:hypothetical protein
MARGNGEFLNTGEPTNNHSRTQTGITTMADPNPTSSATPPIAERGFFKDFFIKHAPYVILLVLALAGVAVTDLSPPRSLPYWQAVVPVFGLICIITQWRHVEPEQSHHIRLIWTQALHWGAVLLVMRLLFVHDIQELLDSDITGLVLLYLLALSTFLAGIYLDWRLSVVGFFLVVSALALAFLDEAALPMAVLAVIILVVFALWGRLRAKIIPQ